MLSKRMRWKKATAILATGVVLINLGNCLPKDYFYRFGAAGQSTILSAFADFVFGSITDSLFPGSDDDVDTNGV